MGAASCYPESMDVEDLLALLENPGDNEIPPTIYDDLRGAYSAMNEGSAAKVAELNATIEALTADNQRLKAHNYELLTVPPVSDNENGESPEDEDNTDVVDDSNTTIDDLFGKDEG